MQGEVVVKANEVGGFSSVEELNSNVSFTEVGRLPSLSCCVLKGVES